MSNPVSLTIRRPGSISGSSSESDFKVPHLPRHLHSESVPGSPLARSATSSPKRTYQQHAYGSDDSDAEEENFADELVTGFDQFGVQRLHEKKKQAGPLVIAPQQNRDWRQVARKRKNVSRYVPASAKAVTGADGSVGGLGTKDTINSGPVNQGLHIRKKVKVESSDDFVKLEASRDEDDNMETVGNEDEDARALRLLLAGSDESGEGAQLEAIPIAPLTESDAFKQDVDELPDAATLDDYARVPVAQFGAALLRGMGWKEGTAASKTKKGPVEPWLPTSRPALLGLGAKEREVLDDGSKPKLGAANKKPEKRYVPIIRQERNVGGGGSSGGGTPSGRSRSPSSTSERPRESSSRREGRDDRGARESSSRRDGRDYDRSRDDRDRRRDNEGKDRRWNDDKPRASRRREDTSDRRSDSSRDDRLNSRRRDY